MVLGFGLSLQRLVHRSIRDELDPVEETKKNKDIVHFIWATWEVSHYLQRIQGLLPPYLLL
jgi:hypothetical protein